MSSCFLCDCSYAFLPEDQHPVYASETSSDNKYFKRRPIIIGSAGYGDDQQHENGGKQNYISYKIKRLEFEFTIPSETSKTSPTVVDIPDYVLIVKLPFSASSSIFDFTSLGDFVLFRNPEVVLAYEVLPYYLGSLNERKIRQPRQYRININKPFIVSPTEIVLVFYMFTQRVSISASARVWFDVV